ncbi:26S proteasome non-ATPase regulatory subunit 5-like [Daphnia carinata]|uniref:26S proteasome non-ATPase regulatory subunit 5-like n=1 Tax=Daphnia carinata TaxID=120202 RepID=UPI00257FFF0B|nr:26S proteasome non-ATPase regulatory subunit 5-like [Daphnia carinata]XP_057373715.1 26S proteasome non-ATPase regulatory subunit 5-like [Daphnia carinata]
MSSPLDETTKLLAGLSLGGSCMKTLESLRILLASVSLSELKDYAPKIDIDRIYKCLATSNKDQIDLTCEILKRILGAIPIGHAMVRYEDLFLQGLAHSESQVKELIFQELQMAADDPTTCEQLATKLEILLSCLQLIGSTDESIASKASRVFMSIARQGDTANVLVSPPIVEEMRTVSRKSDIVRYRIYDIVVTYCCTSEEKLTFCEEHKLIQTLLEEVSTDDILVQLNALELITTLASCQHGRNYLERQGITQKLATRLDEATADPLASLLVPGLMKYFGALAHFQPEVLSRYSNFTNTMFNLIDDADISLKMISIETISFIAMERDGKLALNQQGSKMDDAIKTMGSLFTHAFNEVRLKALNSFAELTHVPPTETIDEEVRKIIEHWFFMLNPKPIQFIMNVTKQPFRDLRFSALNILLQLVPHMWAQKLMSQEPGFLEFLLDRRGEPDKECLEMKFNIVKRLSETLNPECKIWSEYCMAQMRDHVREGLWFARAQSTVALESGP